MRKSTITKSRELFENTYKIQYIDGKFYQNKIRAGLTEIKTYVSTTKHKYGKDLSYQIISVYNYDTKKITTLTYHTFLYAWFIGEVPAGYDVDHIDGDTLNNDLNNLQILTREENLAKRGGGRNQYGTPKRVYCVELDKVYSGIYQACKELSITRHYVTETLDGKNPKKAKYHFRYVEDVA